MAKLSDKLTKVDEDVTVTRADNGFIVTVSGRDSEEDWATAKILCNTLEEVMALIEEASTMERN
jgi:hypothetical protein